MLESFCDWLILSLGLGDSALGQTLHFFIYDSVKIILLLFFMIAAIGFLRSYIPQRKIKGWLSGKKGLSYLFASLFGAITPFCSCSSIPIFISFLEAGVPLGPAFAFLVTSPLINEYLAVLMFGFFGWKITLAYIGLGILLGTVSGIVIGRLKMEDQIVADLVSSNGNDNEFTNLKSRIDYGIQEAITIVRKLWPWIILGVGIGALIHGFVPEEFIQNAINRAGILSVPIAAVLGVPIYANCSAVVPIALVLFQKGVPLGTALAFMMATAALSLPEAVILRRVMKIRLILLFFGLVCAGIIVLGYVFNLLQGVLA
ncbi:MAG: permease [Candidatus Altiarchaeales archaeon]|nr:permease [Candidatus Altiarchaeota archaeon]MBU4341660.1 permease [Candidatus Altiarchaeota archaeon]MBU4406512.1 permease [Candidatus Altiarchaeota archaeon]MBU4437845.1 permease [Candidatus Altiarchaeota archaeon]MCG2783440.1 permease [Candidatus Altiarchaeales archaeon]